MIYNKQPREGRMLPVVIDCRSIHGSSVKTSQPDVAAFFFFLSWYSCKMAFCPSHQQHVFIYKLFPTLPCIVCQNSLSCHSCTWYHTVRNTPSYLLHHCGMDPQTPRSPDGVWYGGFNRKPIETRSPIFHKQLSQSPCSKET